MKIEFSKQFFSKEAWTSNFVKIHLMGVKLFYADVQTDITQLTIAERDFEKAPKNISSEMEFLVSKCAFENSKLLTDFKVVLCSSLSLENTY
jgi:hypothetical protein